MREEQESVSTCEKNVLWLVGFLSNFSSGRSFFAAFCSLYSYRSHTWENEAATTKLKAIKSSPKSTNDFPRFSNWFSEAALSTLKFRSWSKNILGETETKFFVKLKEEFKQNNDFSKIGIFSAISPILMFEWKLG